MPLKVLVFCTVEAGLDSVSLVLSKGYKVEGMVGLNPSGVDKDKVSGFVDISSFCNQRGIPYLFVNRYDLKNDADIQAVKKFNFDLIWVSGWQRLIPVSLISEAPLGAIGGHGSPDGIVNGRGRSPQNWALLLSAEKFEVSLFRITPGIDDGPVVMTRSFSFSNFDDISLSQKKTSICMAEMVSEVLASPSLLNNAIPQKQEGFYYPQRMPDDGFVDWSLNQEDISRHCRALSKPYPGLRSARKEVDVRIWACQPFDGSREAVPGSIEIVFEDGSFLVSCGDGRIIVTDYEFADGSTPEKSDILTSQKFSETMKKILERHEKKFPELPIAARILNYR